MIHNTKLENFHPSNNEERETKICPITKQNLYKCEKCGKWEHDVSLGLCQACYYFCKMRNNIKRSVSTD